MGDREENSPPRPGDSGVRTEFSAEETPTEVTIRALAIAKDVEPTALPPLYDAIDPDALDALFELPASASEADLAVEFSAAGYRVHVTGDGTFVLLSNDGPD